MRRSRGQTAQASRRVTARARFFVGQVARGGRRFVPPAVGLGALVLTAVGMHAGWGYASRSPHLSVRQIEFAGHHRADPEDLMRRAAVAVGHPILTLDLDAMAMRVREHPWVERVTVRRRLPDSLKVDLVEHTPALMVSLGQTFVASPQGELFKRFDVSDRLALPVVTGLSVVGVKENPLEIRAQLAQAVALSIALKKHETILGRLEEIHWDADRGWSVVARPKNFLGPEITRSPLPIMRGHLGFAPRQKVAALVASVAETRARGAFPRVVWADFPVQLSRIQVESWEAEQLETSFAPVPKAPEPP